VDVSSQADRLRAYETIKAYCSDHLLHLVALILFPPEYESPSEPISPKSATIFQELSTSCKFISLNQLKDVIWHNTVFREITELVLITQEYIRLLRNSGGRIIVISGCSKSRILSGFGFNSLLDDTRRSIAHTLSCELYPLGIRVASVVSGPVTKPTQRVLDDRGAHVKRADLHRTVGTNYSRPGLLEKILQMLVVREEDLIMAIQRIANSRYPKVDYYVGLYPFILSALRFVPSSIFVLVQRWIC